MGYGACSTEANVMTTPGLADVHAFCHRIASQTRDALRQLTRACVEQLMSAEVAQPCGAPSSACSEGRTSHRNGFRERRWDTRMGADALQIPKLRPGAATCSRRSTARFVAGPTWSVSFPTGSPSLAWSVLLARGSATIGIRYGSKRSRRCTAKLGPSLFGGYDRCGYPGIAWR